MPHRVAAFTLACGLTFSPAAADSLNIASTSLCGDAYVLALAPDQISHLSWQSRDPLSLASDTQRKLPQAWDDPEVLIGLEADVILFGPGEGFNTARFLKDSTVNSAALTWGEDFDTVRKNVDMVASALKTDSAPLLSDLDARLASLSTRAKERLNTPRILYLSRSGGTAGPGTYVNAAITAAGGKNVVTASGWFTPDPETIMSYDPDIILTSFFDRGYESINSNGLRHRAVQTFLSNYPRINVPGELWPCAGPGFIYAAEVIADGLDRWP